MLREAQQFWDAIAGKVRQLVRSETQNALRCERYEVTTPADGEEMGVTLPMGENEIFLPYSEEVADAAIGDPVLVVWWRSMSNAKVCYRASGFRGTPETAVMFSSNLLPGGYQVSFTIPAGSRHVVFGLGNDSTSQFLVYFTRMLYYTPEATEIYKGSSNVTFSAQNSTITVANATNSPININIMTFSGNSPTAGTRVPI